MSLSLAPGQSVPLSSLFNFSDPDVGDSVVSFDVQDRTAGGGHLTLNGVAQPDNVIFGNSVPIPISQLGQWAYVAGPAGSVDFIGFNAIDSHGAISPSATATVTATALANHPPTATGVSLSLSPGQSVPLSSLFNFSDPDAGDSVVSFDVQDRTAGGGHLTLNGVAQPDNVIFGNSAPIPIGQLGQWAYVAGPAGSVDSIGFNAIDSHGAISPSATATVTATAPANHPPTATGASLSLSPGQSVPLSSLFNFSDPDAGDSVVSFDVQDRTAGGGHLTLNGVAQPDNVIFGNSVPIPVGQLSQWAYVAGPAGSVDSIGFNAIDSHGAISPSATATVTATAPANHPPTATGVSLSLSPGQSVPLSSLFNFSDPDAGDSVVSFDVQDRSAGGGHLTLNGVAQPDNVIFGNSVPIPIGQLGQWAYVAGPAGSVDSVGFNAIDSHGAISPSATATVTATAPANHPPTATGVSLSLSPGQSVPLSSLFNFSDPDAGDSVVSFDVQDRTAGGGHLTLNGVAQPDNVIFGNSVPIPVGQLSQWAYVAGPAGSVDSIGFNAIDSHGAISPSATATVTATAAANHPPTATGVSVSLSPGQSVPLSSLFNFSDPDAGDSVVSFGVQDRTAGGGHLTLNGVAQPDNVIFGNSVPIPVGQLSQWAYVAGPAGSVDSLGFNAIDSHGAISPSATATVTATAAANHPPTASGVSLSLSPGQSVPLSSLFNFSDPDAGDSVVSFDVQDRTAGGGHLTLNGVAQPDNVIFGNSVAIPIGQLSQWAYVAGPSGSVDSIGFNAIDSHGAISPSATATVTATATAPANHPPTASGTSLSLSPGQSVPLSSLFNFSDPDSGDSVVSFDVQDRTAGGGHLTLNGVAQADNVIFGNSVAIPISQLAQWGYVAGPAGSADSIGFNAIDSHGAISPSATATVTVQGVANHSPSVSGASLSLAPGQSVPLSSLFNFSDPDAGDSVVSFDVQDRTAGGGHLTLNGVAQPDNVIFGNSVPIPVGQLGQWAYVAGPAGSVDSIGFNAIDSHGAISPSGVATVTATGGQSGAVTISPGSVTISERAGSSTFTISRTDTSTATDLIISTVQGQTPNNGYYVPILNHALHFAAGVGSAQITLTVNDLGLTSGSETFKLIAQQHANDPGSLASSTFTIVNDDSPTGALAGVGTPTQPVKTLPPSTVASAAIGSIVDTVEFANGNVDVLAGVGEAAMDDMSKISKNGIIAQVVKGVSVASTLVSLATGGYKLVDGIRSGSQQEMLNGLTGVVGALGSLPGADGLASATQVVQDVLDIKDALASGDGFQIAIAFDEALIVTSCAVIGLMADPEAPLQGLDLGVSVGQQLFDDSQKVGALFGNSQAFNTWLSHHPHLQTALVQGGLQGLLNAVADDLLAALPAPVSSIVGKFIHSTAAATQVDGVGHAGQATATNAFDTLATLLDITSYYLLGPQGAQALDLQAEYLRVLRAALPNDQVNATLTSLQTGALTTDTYITDLVHQSAATSSVATLAYEFFTGKAPSAAGMDYLVSPTGPNPNNLNSAYYQSFSLENRYINFAVNLGKLGEGAAQFAQQYGSLSLFEATRQAYAMIFGGTPSDTKLHALLDPTFQLNGVTMTRADYFAYYGQDGAGGIGTKAAMVGWLLSEAVKADLGTYALSNDAFLTDVALHNAPFAVDIVGHYNQPAFAFQPG